MGTCENCGNEYDKAFQVVMKGETHTRLIASNVPFMRWHRPARTGGTRIVGHGLESDGVFYCCDHCAQKDGVKKLRDRV